MSNYKLNSLFSFDINVEDSTSGVDSRKASLSANSVNLYKLDFDPEALFNISDPRINGVRHTIRSNSGSGFAFRDKLLFKIFSICSAFS